MDCLYTHLKGSVSADIYKLNELRMFLPAGNSVRLQGNVTLVNRRTFTITVLDGSVVYDSVTYNSGSIITVVAGARKDLSVPNTGDAVISISDKDAFVEFDMSGDRVSSISGRHRAVLNPDFGYMENATHFAAYMKYDCEILGKFPLLEYLGSINYYQIFIPNVWRKYVNSENFPSLLRLVCSSMDTTDQVNIDAFSSLTKLTQLRLTNSVGFIGSLESLADGQLSYGRTSGTMDVYPNSIITYQGTGCDNSKTYSITFSSGSYSIAVS